MKEEHTSPTEEQHLESYFHQIHTDYEAALSYQHSDPRTALIRARLVAEGICRQLWDRKRSEHPRQHTPSDEAKTVKLYAIIKHLAKASYITLSDLSLAGLQDRGIPESILNALHTLRDTQFFSEQEFSHRVTATILDILPDKRTMKLYRDAVLKHASRKPVFPPWIVVHLKRIQEAANFAAHPSDPQDEAKIPAFVQPCLQSLFEVVTWYFERYWPAGNLPVPLPLNDSDVQQAEAFRRTKETAILIFVFLDIVNSTQLREEFGEVRFGALLQEQKQALSAIIERDQKGKVVKDTGDGLLCVFAMTDIAVRRALEIQETLSSHPAFSVRIGIDMGQVTQETEHGIVQDVFGAQVNRAARLEALCEAGHVLTSYTVYDNARGWLKHIEHLAWKKHGSYWLKGIADSQEIYEPYDTRRTEPVAQLQGKQATTEEAGVHCTLCGRYVKLTDTFKCPTCGREGICMHTCFNTEHQQCLECAATRTPDMPPEARKILDLHNPEASFTIRIWTEPGQKQGSNRNMVVVPKREFGQYRLSDAVTAYFQSSIDAYVYMINIGPTGDITHIFPNDYSSDNRVTAGTQYTFPENDAPFEWILQEPAGIETIKVIATKVPIDIDRFLGTQAPTVRNIDIRPRLAESLHPDQWAEASCTLLVQK